METVQGTFMVPWQIINFYRSYNFRKFACFLIALKILEIDFSPDFGDFGIWKVSVSHNDLIRV